MQADGLFGQRATEKMILKTVNKATVITKTQAQVILPLGQLVQHGFLVKWDPEGYSSMFVGTWLRCACTRKFREMRMYRECFHEQMIVQLCRGGNAIIFTYIFPYEWVPETAFTCGTLLPMCQCCRKYMYLLPGITQNSCKNSGQKFDGVKPKFTQKLTNILYINPDHHKL